MIFCSFKYSTIASMCFSIVSVLLSVVETCFKTKTMNKNGMIIFKFDVNSDILAPMDYKKKNKKYLRKRKSIVHNMGELLRIDPHQVECLRPLSTANGARLTVLVTADTPDVSEKLQKFKEEYEHHQLNAVKF